MTMRNYQINFFTLNTKVGDVKTRLRRAAKIEGLLRRHAGRDLSQTLCLDLGCSSGVMTCALASNFRHIAGLDFDEIAFQHLPPGWQDMSNVSFLRGDAMQLPLPPKSVDVIICAQVYEHVPSDIRLVEEVTRVLKPDGLVFFSGPNWLFPVELHYNLPFLHWLPERMADGLLKLLGKGSHYYERSRSQWGLRQLWRDFAIEDLTWAVAQMTAAGEFDAIMAADGATPPPQTAGSRMMRAVVRATPTWLQQFLVPLMPNFNYLLRFKRQR
jgi:2-polyprenyl-3-methyl-5-hydroxy-6-metoxy-1,4-benzoquinol methylase